MARRYQLMTDTDLYAEIARVEYLLERNHKPNTQKQFRKYLAKLKHERNNRLKLFNLWGGTIMDWIKVAVIPLIAGILVGLIAGLISRKNWVKGGQLWQVKK